MSPQPRWCPGREGGSAGSSRERDPGDSYKGRTGWTGWKGRTGGKRGSGIRVALSANHPPAPPAFPAPPAQIGAGGQTRTVDPALMRRVLSPTELLRRTADRSTKVRLEPDPTTA